MLNELEGLARGADTRDSVPGFKATLNPEHVARVAENAKAALAFARSRNPAIRCLTTRGTVLTSSTFTVEEDVTQVRMLFFSFVITLFDPILSFENLNDLKIISKIEQFGSYDS